MPLDSLLDSAPAADKQLALRRFGCFAHAEHTLKVSGFARRGQENAAAKEAGAPRRAARVEGRCSRPRLEPKYVT